MKTYVAALDGIPGVMTGLLEFDLSHDQEFENEDAPTPMYKEKSYSWRGANIPRHKWRILPCNKD